MITEELRRLKRNALLMSMWLIFYNVAEIKFDSFGIFRSNLTVGKEEWIEPIFWIIWIYFCWRYLQYRKDSDHSFRLEYSKKLKSIVTDTFNLERLSDPVKGVVSDWFLEKKNALQWQARRSPLFDDPNSESEIREIPILRLLQCRFSAYMSMVFVDRLFLDHFLPLLIILATPLVAFLTN